MPNYKAAILCAMVGDQDEAIAWYTEKLGFEQRDDTTFGDFRWVTVGVPGQPELEIALMEPKPGMVLDEETAAQLERIRAYEKALGYSLWAVADRLAQGEGQFRQFDRSGPFVIAYAPPENAQSPLRP